MQPLNFLLQSATNPSPAFVISAEPETTGSDFHQYEKQYKESYDAAQTKDSEEKQEKAWLNKIHTRTIVLQK